MAADHDSYAVFRYPEYNYFTFSRGAYAFGSMMQSVALGWQVYEYTDSALALGLMGLVQVLPSIALSLWAGRIADRGDRRNILIGTQFLQTLCSAGLMFVTLTGTHSVVPIFILLFLMGIAGGFQNPASSAILPDLVPSNLFAHAVAWQTTAFHVCALAGPLAGGYLLGWHHNPAHVYGVKVLLGLISTLTLLGMKSRPFQQPEDTVDEGFWQSMVSGIHFVWSKPVILGSITLDLFAVLFGGAVALLPIFAKDILHVGPQGLGFLKAATPTGGAIMAFFMVHRPPIQRSGPAFLGSVAAFGVAMIGFGLSRNFYLSMFFLALSGAVDNVSMVVRSTILQVLTPNAMRGRVSAVSGVFIGASNEIGAFESGVAARFLGTAPSVYIGGVLTLFSVALCAWKWPQLGQLGPLDRLEDAVDEGSIDVI